MEKPLAEKQLATALMRQQLTLTNASLHLLAEHLPVMLVTINRDQTIGFINCAIGNRPPETLVGTPAVTIHTQANNQILLQQVMDYVFQTGETFSYECEETTGKGHAWYMNRLSAVKQAGQVTTLLLIATEITEQKQAALTLAQTQKFESLATLAGGIAHNFNNLLAAMLIQLSLAASKLSADHPVNQHILRTMTAAERAAELTRQMLSYAGRSPADTLLFDLNDLILDNLSLFAASIPKTVSLQPKRFGSIPLMLGDKGQLKQLIMNLISNSAEAIGEKPGLITLETGIQELTDEETQDWQRTGDRLTAGCYIKLEVQDSGCGMDAKTLTKLFDPFFTTKFAGRGLGLASVLGIVRSHKGGIHVSSTVDQGTTFTLLFPIQTDAP